MEISLKKKDFFNIFAPNMHCGYKLEPPRWSLAGAVLPSTHNACFGSKLSKYHTPANPSFFYIKVGFFLMLCSQILCCCCRYLGFYGELLVLIVLVPRHFLLFKRCIEWYNILFHVNDFKPSDGKLQMDSIFMFFKVT